MIFNFLIELSIFIFGLAIGSFLNCVIYRLEVGEGFLKGRSYCPHCKHKLIWQDLIPVFSFLILKGKCRYCHQKISLQYPLVELVTGTLFLSTFQLTINNQQLTISSVLDTCFLFLAFCFLIIIFVYDLKYYIIPDKVIYPAIIVAFFYNIYQLTINNQQLTISNFLSALGAALFFLAIVLISGGKWMGFGDVKLAFFMGLFLSFPNILVALFLAFSIGAIIGLGLVISGKKSLKSEVPFGPFLVTGTFIALFWGEKLINWYLPR